MDWCLTVSKPFLILSSTKLICIILEDLLIYLILAESNLKCLFFRTVHCIFTVHNECWLFYSEWYFLSIYGVVKGFTVIEIERLSSWLVNHTWVNSLVPGRFKVNFRWVILKLILVVNGWGISCETALIWVSLDHTYDKSTLVQVMAWCRQATSHYLSQCWPRSLSPYGITRPQWVNKGCQDDSLQQQSA